MVALLSAYESEEKPKVSILESMGLGFGWWEREREREKICAKEKNIFFYVDILF